MPGSFGIHALAGAASTTRQAETESENEPHWRIKHHERPIGPSCVFPYELT